MTKSKRKAFDASCKPQLVEMTRDQGLSNDEVCGDLLLGETAVRRWLTQVDVEQLGQRGIGKPSTTKQQNISQHEAEYRRRRSDVDMPKKASAFFVRELR